MSICLAQTLPTTQPITVAIGLVGFLVMAGGLPASLYLMRRHRLLSGLLRPQAPEDDASNALVGVALLMGYAAQILVLSLAAKLEGVDPRKPDFARQMLMLQPLALAASVVAVAFFLAITHPQRVGVLRLNLHRPLRDLRTALAGYAIVLPWMLLASAITAAIAHLLGQPTDTMHAVFESWEQESPGLTPAKVVLFTMAVIFAPVAEEILFRGLLQRFVLNLVRYPILAVVLSAAAFAAIHNPWQARPIVFVLALGLGWTYLRSGSLLSVILLHAVFNLVSFTFFLCLAPG